MALFVVMDITNSALLFLSFACMYSFICSPPLESMRHRRALKRIMKETWGRLCWVGLIWFGLVRSDPV